MLHTEISFTADVDSLLHSDKSHGAFKHNHDNNNTLSQLI